MSFNYIVSKQISSMEASHQASKDWLALYPDFSARHSGNAIVGSAGILAWIGNVLRNFFFSEKFARLTLLIVPKRTTPCVCRTFRHTPKSP